MKLKNAEVKKILMGKKTSCWSYWKKTFIFLTALKATKKHFFLTTEDPEMTLKLYEKNV